MFEDDIIDKELKDEINRLLQDKKITPSEIEKILKESFLKATNHAAEESYHSLRSKIPDMIRENNEMKNEFESRLYETWGKPLDLLEAFLIISREIGANFYKENCDTAINDEDYKFVILTRIHAQACQITGEILKLLRGGYADGANARWRSLYEIVVTAYFINKNNQDTAKRYLDHENIDKYKRNNEMMKYTNQLKISTISEDELELLKKERKKLIKKYGKSFKQTYGWAAESLGIKRPNFRQIAQDVGFDHMWPYYQLACLPVHTGPTSILFDLGMPEPNTLLLAGPSNRGLADPGQGAAISLHQLNTLILSKIVNFENVISMKISQYWIDELKDEFINVHRRVEEITVKNIEKTG